MKHFDLAGSLCAWITETYNHPEWREQNHCFTVRRSVRLPAGGLVDAISVAHRGSVGEHRPDAFYVNLWQLEPGVVGLPALDRMNRHLQVFGAWYSEFLETAQCRGFTTQHCLRVSGNLVGASVQAEPILDLLSHWAGNVSIWTYRETGNGMEVEPYTGVERSLRPARRRLTDLLKHLPWRDLEVPLAQEAPR
jgi:hypothetical protein